MTLKENLLFRGYLPENLPPAFFSSDLADYLVGLVGDDWWSQSKSPVRPATYNASKRGITRRVFSVVHPTTMRDSAKFVAERWDAMNHFFEQTDMSLSIPKEAEDGDRAIEINTHSFVEGERISRLSQFRFIAKTDISRFYHSIYTHSLPWAFHGKPSSKGDRKEGSKKIYFNRADHILRCGQDGQTVGIPVGPDTSRVLAEVIATAIDIEFKKRCDVNDLVVMRHVDDVWIGAHTFAEAERALWRYREAMREFELDINESKTKIYSSDFRFADAWPTELSTQLENSLGSSRSQSSERLRAALEHAFALTVSTGDDAILKFVIRYLDRHSSGWDNWSIAEPFLKRCVVHFGHTVDYVARVIVWRDLAKGDLDKPTWSRILSSIIDTHGRIGNDSEVCWATYAMGRIGSHISQEAAENIVRNCGALSLLALLNCAEKGLADKSVFDVALARMNLESAGGAFWPVLLEWKSRQWQGHEKLDLRNEVVAALAEEEAVLFDIDRLPSVFADVKAGDFDEVQRAIENRPSMYDNDNEDDGDLDEDDFMDESEDF